MKKLVAALVNAGFLLTATLVMNLSFYVPAQAHGQKTLHVVEHAITDTVQQFHAPKNSLGDVLGFHNPVFNEADKKQVGYDNGFCIRTVATGKTEWECSWTLFLNGSQVTVQGPYFDDGTDTLLTITGGTG